MNWWDRYEYNSNSKPKPIHIKTYEIFKDSVYLYFDLECSTDKLLIDYHSDKNGNNIFHISLQINNIIFNSAMHRDSVNNCAMNIKQYLDSINV